MSRKDIVIYEGEIQYGKYYDDQNDLYIDTDRIESIFSGLLGSNVRLTIEKIDRKVDDDDE